MKTQEHLLQYAFSCAARNRPFAHYAMNYGRTVDMTDVFKLTREQYDVIYVMVAKAGKTEH